MDHLFIVRTLMMKLIMRTAINKKPLKYITSVPFLAFRFASVFAELETLR